MHAEDIFQRLQLPRCGRCWMEKYLTKPCAYVMLVKRGPDGSQQYPQHTYLCKECVEAMKVKSEVDYLEITRGIVAG